MRMVFILALAVACSARGGDGRREISQALMPYTITNGGSYVLTENLAGTNGAHGIVIAADDVTLDLNGFTIAGVAGSLSGIAVISPQMNLVVRNGTIRNWGIHGLDAFSASNGLLQGLVVSRCGQDGLRTGSGWLIERCALTSHGRDGVAMSDRTVVAEAVTRGNGRHGMQGGDLCIVASSESRENGASGISLGRYAQVARSTLRDNGGHGIEVGQASLVAEAVAYGSLSNGVVAGSGSRVERTQVSSAGAVGIVAPSGVSVQECTVKNSTNGGLVVGDRCFVADNSVDECLGGPGILVTGYGNRVEGNNLTRNLIGVQVTGTSNFVFKNTAFQNSPTNFSFSSSTTAEIVTNPGGSANDGDFEEPWCNFDLF